MRTRSMHLPMAPLWIALLAVAAACGGAPAPAAGDKGDAKGDAKAPAPAADGTAPSAGGDAPAPAATVEAPEPMKNFLAKFDGTDAAVAAALKEFGKDGLADDDMSMFMLKDPKVTAVEGDCSTFVAAAGMTERTYVVCWKDGKIDSVKDKSGGDE